MNTLHPGSSSALRRAVRLGGLALAAAPLAAQFQPPPWFGVQDNDTVTIGWDYNNGSGGLTTALMPSVLVVPSWFTGAPWRIGGNISWQSSLTTHTGVVGLTTIGSASLDTNIDNDPRTDWVKIFWSETELAAAAPSRIEVSLIEPAGTRLRNVERKLEVLASGWSRQTVSGDIFPQPDAEQLAFSFTNQQGAAIAVDDTYTTTRCVPKENFDTGESLGESVGNAIDVETLTGNPDCHGVCTTLVGTVRRFWVSGRRRGTGQAHELYEIDANGALVATHAVPIGNSQGGMIDLAVDETGPTVYGILDTSNGPVILPFDVTTGQFMPTQQIALQAAPFSRPGGLAFNPDGDRGNGTFWVADLPAAGAPSTAFEYDARGRLQRGVASRSWGRITGAGYDRIEGMAYWFSRRSTPSGVEVVGRQFDVAAGVLTGTAFYGNIRLAGVPAGGLSGGLHAYRDGGLLRMLCLAEGGTGGKDTIYSLGAPFEYGNSCLGGIGMEGVPFQGNSQWAVKLRGVEGATAATLFLGLSRTTFRGMPLPLELDVVGLRRCAILASLDIDAGTTAVVGGEARVAIPLPVDPALSYAKTYWQWIVLDPMSPRGVAMSRGGQTVIY